MRKIFLILMLWLAYALNGAPLDDLRFAIGLYSDGNYELAQSELNKFIKTNPESVYLNDARFLLANSLLSLQRYSEAIKEFARLDLPNIDPVIKADVILGQAQCRYFLKQPVEAEKQFKDFLNSFKNHPLSWKAQYFLGRLAADRDEHEKALQLFSAAAAEQDDSELNLAIMKTLVALDRTEEADKQISKLIFKEPADEQIVIIYNNYNLQKGRWQNILAAVIPQINSRSQYYADYHLLRGIAYYNLGGFAEALAELKRCSNEKAEYYTALCHLKMADRSQAAAILTSLVNSEQEEIRANSYFHLAMIEENIPAANQKLEKFTQDFPQSDFVPIAHYLIGFNNFENGNFAIALEKFREAAQSAEKIASAGFAASYQENNTFLTAESLLLNEQSDVALAAFKTYLSDYPKGSFQDEAVYKIGLIYFEQRDLSSAAREFNLLLERFPDSSKTGMSNYYLGEIELLQNDLKAALSYFEEALQGRTDPGYTWERIAQIHFQNKNYQRALEALENIPSESRYMFAKFFLEGNANFAIRRLDKALQAFEFAEEYALDNRTREIALSRKAATLYQMKRFKEASQIYSRLASTTDDPQAYLIKAANAAFSAEDFLRAIDIYKQYIEKFNQTEDAPSALLGIADSYYNLGKYFSAASYYRKLIIPGSSSNMLVNALNGLRWSAEQDKSVDFIQIINELLNSHQEINYRFELLSRKLHYYFSKKDWNQSIRVADEMEKLSPDHSALADIKLIKALSYSELMNYDRAESIYQDLGADKPSAEILFNWALLKEKQADVEAAVELLRQAVQLTKRMDVWTRLLELQISKNDIHFQNDLARFQEIAENEYSQLGELFLIEWKIMNRRTEYESRLKELENSKYNIVRAYVQYLKGYQLYITGNYKDAIPEFLRVRYLHPEFDSIRLKAEIMALEAYLLSNRLDDAKQLFDLIRKDLSEQQKNDFGKRLEQEIR